MRNKQWLRYSLASFTLIGGALGAFLVACGDDDDVTPSTVDSGTGTDTGPGGGGDTGTPGTDSGTDAAVDAGPPNAKLQLVNAATNFGPANGSGALRVCYGVGPTEAVATTLPAVAPLPPLPDEKSNAAQPFPGVFIGTGGNVKGTGANLADLVIVPYVMNAQTLGTRGLVKPGPGNAGVSCTDLLGAADAGGPMIANVDYWKLPAIQAQTLVKGKSFILVLTGCTADAVVAPAGKCGPNWVPTPGVPGIGNLTATVHEVDRATAAAVDKIGTQFIHASAAADAVLVGVSIVPAYTKDPTSPDASTPVNGNTVVPLGGKTPFAQIGNVKFDAPSDYFTGNPLVPTLAIPLTSIQQLSYGATPPDGGAYRNGASFTFIALGDPTEDSDAGTGFFNTKKFHYIALPNDPASETYKP